MSQYTIIHNPQSLLNKHEVWYAGEVETQDSKGYKVREQVVMKAKSFRTEEGAKSYIQYQLDVRSFREQAEAGFAGNNVRSIAAKAK